MELRIPIADLAVLLGKDASKLSAEQLREQLVGFYGFLPNAVSVGVEGEMVVLRWPKTADAKKSEAERLARKAAQRAERGEHAKARDILKTVLELDPSATDARRDLAMVCVELGEMEDAKNHLIEVLKLNPKDAWALVILANNYVREDEDFDTAKQFLRRALELKPDDPWAMNSLAAVLTQTGDSEEGMKLCEEILRKHPGFAIPYMNKALWLIKDQKFQEAAAILREMFRCGESQDARAAETFKQARDTYVKVQNLIANNKRAQSEILVDQLAAKAGELSGFPVKVTTGPLEAMVAAKVAMAWKHGTDHHLLTIREGDIPEILKDHHALHELHHVLMETEARKAGENRWFTTTPETRKAAFAAMDKEVRQMERKGYEAEAIAQGVNQLYHGAVGFLYNCPLDMLIEQRIARDFPEISEVQFCGVAQLAHDALTVTMRKDLRDFVPPTLQRINDALNGAYALFVDDLFEQGTALAANYRGMPTFPLSENLYGMWKEANASFRPSAEYELVDAFADQLGIRDWYAWKLDSGSN
jgi:tetratricopeptide (TPR) repeat protein